MTAPRTALTRQPDFLKLWAAESISQFGTQVSLLAIPLIAALFLHVDPFAFSLLGVVEMLPFILISLPAGVWVDRLRRRPILIVGDLGRAVALLSIPVAYALGGLTIWQLYIVGFVNGVLTVFFDVAYQSYLPALVDREDILEGNSKLEISRSAAQIVGPGISGFLIGVITAPFAVVVDAISFLGSALFVFGIRKAEPVPERPKTADGKHPSMRSEIAAGLRYVLGSPYLRNIAACTGSSNLFGNLGFSIMILYLVRDLAFTPELLGIAFSVGSVGALLGAVTANRFGKRFGVGRTIVGSILVGSPPLLLIALAPANSMALVYVAASTFLGSFGSVVYNISQVSFRQAITPERMQGRMNATMRFIVWGTIPVGALLGGFLAGTIGLLQTIWVGAILSFLPVLPVLFSPVRSIREMPAPVGDTPSAETIGEALDETPRLPGSDASFPQD